MDKKNDEKRKENMTENNEAIETSPELKQEEQTPKNEGCETIHEDTKIKEKLSSLENQYIRLMADYQNLQKRAAQEKEDLYKYAAQKTIEILLPALDTFDYAKSTVKPDTKPEKIIEDFNLVLEMVLKCLNDIGLETIEETGIPFNPFHHEPLNQVPTNELPDQTVMQILKKGYMLNKKVIRPALVSVSVKEEAKQ